MILNNKIVITIITSLVLFIFIPSVRAQEGYPLEKLKCLLIIKIIEDINWENKNEIIDYKIGVTSPIIFENLKNIIAQTNTKKRLSSILLTNKNNKELTTCNIVYLDEKESKNLSSYKKLLSGEKILLISDEYSVPEEIMVNLIVNKNSKLSFEINKQNLEAEGFSVSTDLIIFGGSLSEVKKLFTQTEKEIAKEKENIIKLQKDIAIQKQLLTTQREKIDSQKSFIEKQESEITKNSLINNKLIVDIESARKKISAKEDSLKSIHNFIEKQKTEIATRIKDIAVQEEVLKHQEIEIQKGRLKIQEQIADIKKQKNTIVQQKSIIIIVSAFAFVIGIGLYFLHRNKKTINRINVELANKNKEIEEQNKELESFSYSVSHDLRTPIRAIKGYSQIIKEEWQSKFDEETNIFLERILKATSKMENLTEDLLKLSRVSRHKLNVSKVNLSDLCTDSLTELMKLNSDTSTKIDIQKDIIVNGDEHLLQIFLDNLLGNAWKFTRKSAAPEISVGTIVQDKVLVYYIKDNGAGFNMKYYSKLFNEFTRLHDDLDFPGTGVGLSIAHRIIKKHGGEVWAYSEVGNGATFFFTLPY